MSDRRLCFAPLGGGHGKEYRVLVAYRRDDGLVYVHKEGRGPRVADAIADADRQLRPGIWTRVVCSSPQTIYGDVSGQPLNIRSRQRKQLGEGETILIEPPRVIA